MFYSLALLSKRTHPQSDPQTDDPLWEESIVLIEADSEADAKLEAEKLGRKDETSFTAVSGELVKWEFVRVTAVYEIADDTLKHGTELFSRFLRTVPTGLGNEKPADAI